MKKIYSHKCEFCNSPSRNVSGRIICSNVKCKTWKKVRRQMAKIKLPKLEYVGLTSDDPIKIICNECSEIARHAMYPKQLTASIAYCIQCNKWFDYKYEIGKWYYSKFDNEYSVQYIGHPKWWDLDNEIIK